MRERIVFHGRVQGVGFRAVTHRLCQGRPLAGYVRNLPDGSVEVVADGSAEAIDEFVQAVKNRWGGNVSRVERSPDASTEAFSTFEIRH